MRITVLRQCPRGLAKVEVNPEDKRTLECRLESVKHYLWHGNVARARAELEGLDEDLDYWGCDEDGNPHPQPDGEAAARMLKYVRELATYITNNERSIVNYGERYRNGERISTAFTESTINRW